MVPFADKTDIHTVMITQVPKGYHSTIKKRERLTLTYYNNLLQYTVRNRAMILDLDELFEVATIEAIDTLQDPDYMVSTGFLMSSCKSEP